MVIPRVKAGHPTRKVYLYVVGEGVGTGSSYCTLLCMISDPKSNGDAQTPYAAP